MKQTVISVHLCGNPSRLSEHKLTTVLQRFLVSSTRSSARKPLFCVHRAVETFKAWKNPMGLPFLVNSWPGTAIYGFLSNTGAESMALLPWSPASTLAHSSCCHPSDLFPFKIRWVGPKDTELVSPGACTRPTVQLETTGSLPDPAVPVGGRRKKRPAKNQQQTSHLKK